MGHETLKKLKHTNSSRHPFVLTLIWEHVNPYGRFELNEKCGLRAAPIYFRGRGNLELVSAPR